MDEKNDDDRIHIVTLFYGMKPTGQEDNAEKAAKWTFHATGLWSRATP
jgi:hypothetical protein